MTTAVVRVATTKDIASIVACTNDAFMADAFFKKPEYHLRFTSEDVNNLITKENSCFLMAEDTNTNELVGSIYFYWSVEPSDNGKVQLIGKFSAVSVPEKYSKRGLGKLLVKSFEEYLIETIAPTLGTNQCSKIIGEMGVINLRKDLFPWYEKMGYEVIGEIRPNDAEVSRIILDDLDVCCILMRKVLKTM